MPASASSYLPEALIARLSSADGEARLFALRDLKNQIIGNRTKKLSYIRLGAVPAVVAALSSASDADTEAGASVLVQSAAALGSFACGVDDGVRAVLEAGAFQHLLRFISHPNEKVMDACARSLRMIYQSKLAPKYDFLSPESMGFLLPLLKSDNENLVGLGLSIITHSCETIAEQKALCDAGVLRKLISLLAGAIYQRDATLESLSTILKNNAVVISEFINHENGSALNAVFELTKDRHPRTRLSACICLIVLRNSSSCYLQDIPIRTKLIMILLELLDDPNQVGDEASFALSDLIAENENLQRLAFEANAVDKISKHVQLSPSQAKRMQGLLLALANLCSKLECCRSRFLSLQVLNSVTDALTHDSTEVRTAACICLRSVSRSVKNLSAGHFMNERIINPLIELLHDPCTSVQVAALGAISNILVDFTTRKSTFVQRGGVQQLTQLTKSMDSTVRSSALLALRNLLFFADNGCKEAIFLELTASSLATLICDPEPCVQEQALALARNLVDGCIDSIEYVLAEDALVLHAVGRQLLSFSTPEVGIQGMYVLTNVASGNEFHKDAVMHQILAQGSKSSQSVMLEFLQSNDRRLRTAAIWVIVNLTFSLSPCAFLRFVKLRNAGIISQIKTMVEDPCLDVKLRARIVLGQSSKMANGSQ